MPLLLHKQWECCFR